VPAAEHLPHIDLVLQALRVNRERLNSRSKIAIDARLLKALLSALAGTGRFDAEFYRTTYPDVAAAHAAGDITDLREHYIRSGYFEGRLGAAPDVDEAFYTATYPDVGRAIAGGEIASGTDHYIRSGASEGRIPREDARVAIDAWMSLLRDEYARG
jgi:hypothetical protein